MNFLFSIYTLQAGSVPLETVFDLIFDLRFYKYLFEVSFCESQSYESITNDKNSYKTEVM